MKTSFRGHSGDSRRSRPIPEGGVVPAAGLHLAALHGDTAVRFLVPRGPYDKLRPGRDREEGPLVERFTAPGGGQESQRQLHLQSLERCSGLHKRSRAQRHCR